MTDLQLISLCRIKQGTRTSKTQEKMEPIYKTVTLGRKKHFDKFENSIIKFLEFLKTKDRLVVSAWIALQ